MDGPPPAFDSRQPGRRRAARGSVCAGRDAPGWRPFLGALGRPFWGRPRQTTPRGDVLEPPRPATPRGDVLGRPSQGANRPASGLDSSACPTPSTKQRPSGRSRAVLRSIGTPDGTHGRDRGHDHWHRWLSAASIHGPGSLVWRMLCEGDPHPHGEPQQRLWTGAAHRHGYPNAVRPPTPTLSSRLPGHPAGSLAHLVANEPHLGGRSMRGDRRTTGPSPVDVRGAWDGSCRGLRRLGRSLVHAPSASAWSTAWDARRRS